MDKKKPHAVEEKKRLTFRHLAEKSSRLMGSSVVFFIALVVIIAWGLSGFYFEFSDTWQLIINTGTTIATFLMVILVQNTQNRESRSIQLKLDELIYGTKKTRNTLLEIEEQSDAEIDAFKQEFKQLREEAISQIKKKEQKKPSY